LEHHKNILFIVECSFVKQLRVSAFTQLGHQVVKFFIEETVQYII